MHYNPHKTFSGPHGGGGPGAGPIAVRELPRPVPAGAARRARTTTAPIASTTTGPKSIGRVRAFFGNTGRPVPGLLLHPEPGARRAQGRRRARRPERELPDGAGQGTSIPCRSATAACTSSSPRPRSMARDRGIRAMDIGKRLIDYNFHAPTVYFPLIVPEAMMIEPTETESRETLEAFAEALLAIAERGPRRLLHDAPLRRRSAGPTR